MPLLTAERVFDLVSHVHLDGRVGRGAKDALCGNQLVGKAHRVRRMWRRKLMVE